MQTSGYRPTLLYVGEAHPRRKALAVLRHYQTSYTDLRLLWGWCLETAAS